MLPYSDQAAIIAAMPSATLCTCWGVTFQVDYRFHSEPVVYTDGSVEVGKPYIIVTGQDVDNNNINHGTELTLARVARFEGATVDAVRYVSGKIQKQDGMYRLTLSETA